MTVDQITEIREAGIRAAIKTSQFELKCNLCAGICAKYSLPTTTFLADVKNYSDVFFETKKTDTEDDVLQKKFLHMCVIKHCL